MVRRRIIVLAAAFAIATAASTAIAEQRGGKDGKEQQPKRSKQEQVEIDQLVKTVDGVMAGQPAPGDIQMSLTPYFLKSQEQRTFVPFVLDVQSLPATDVALYVRVVQAGGSSPSAADSAADSAAAAAAAQPKPTDKPDAGKPPARPEYPWDDIHFISAAQLSGAAVTTATATTGQPASPTQTDSSVDRKAGGAPGRIYRVFMAPPGTYDVYIAMKEREPEKGPKPATGPRMGVLKTQVTVPDFWNGDLMTSSVIVADKVNVLTAMPSPEEARERPFVFGAQELVPAADTAFSKEEQLATFFQVYNAQLDPAGQPNLILEYNFHRTEDGVEKFFNKTAPQEVNASMLPPTFDPTKFPVPGGIEVPLKSFPEGEYRLEIKVTDKVSGKVVTRDVNFTVKAS